MNCQFNKRKGWYLKNDNDFGNKCFSFWVLLLLLANDINIKHIKPMNTGYAMLWFRFNWAVAEAHPTTRSRGEGG